MTATTSRLTTALTRALTVLSATGRSVAEAAVPAQCVGCGAWDTVLCEACTARARTVPTRWRMTEGDRGDLPLWVMGDYADTWRRLVLAAKHRDDVDLSGFLRDCGRSLGLALLAARAVDATTPTWVVPAPSSWRRRFDGALVTGHIADGVCEALAAAGVDVVLADVVRLRAGARGQAGRSGAERRSGRVGSMVASARPTAGEGVVLVDDVVTTGATMREMARALGVREVVLVAVCSPR